MVCSFEPRSVVSGSARVRVCGVPRSVSRAAAAKPRASVPARSSGYPAVCTPSPHTVSAPRIELTGHLPYSPDLAPNDFPSMKNKLRGQCFLSREVAVDLFKMHDLKVPQPELKK
ncbi:hypothetical protein EVAR_548_1 [Eumeta japonica]|uniref:Histone-lysine N-methyltransferase SETMAR n=1 Tax=Eumeta variegata TaxID=151549 RepID=A0A4C1SD17_EUMVA|nr:hypothetical protein EVAR_548_1 [Eumeta japonica]